MSASHPSDRISLTRVVLNSAEITRPLHRPDCGAVVVFEGVVRADHVDGQPVRALDYIAYESMAVEQMTLLRERALDAFEILDAAVFHRLGELRVGEVSVVIVVSAAHRAAAFEACAWLMDTVKADVPIWKKDLV